MNKKILEDAINGLGEEVLEQHLEKKRIFSIELTNQKGGTNMKLKYAQNRWFIAFVIAAVIAVAAIATAIVMGVTPKGPDQVVYEPGPETGVYYYDTVDGEIMLTLSDGHKFTISGPKINKTGTYTVDGTNMTLDFFKDEDGTTTATINGESVALAYDNATMTFLKKVAYTVSFNANGGSNIDSATVINGKTVAQPVDPTKKDCVFLGWYADEALTDPYDFNAAAVKANTTVYARWAQKQVGVAEYVVDFDLGYEGAEELNPITTIGGKAYGVAAPERAGYTFVGWWVSMYEDGQRLSYAYTEQTVFTADTTLYAVWHDDSSSKLQAPAVTVSENMITWPSVKGAASYELTIVDPDGKTVVDKETVGTTGRAYDFSIARAGEYKITVVAVAGNEENNSEAAERYYANKTLDRVSDFIVENGILVFGAVENAEKYVITIDCGDEKHVHTALDNGASTTYYIANCPMQDGGIRVTVTASADGYASSTSRVFVYNKVLDKVVEVVYDANNDKFVWDSVEGPVAYHVTVNADGQEYTFNNGTKTSFSVANFTGEIVVSVVPVAEGYNSPEATAGNCKKTAPAAPNGLTAAGMVISWNPVAGATAYEVHIGGQAMTVETNQLDLASGSVILTQGEVYTVKVKAINANNESSSYSETMEIGYFVMSDSLHYGRNTVSWKPVLGVNQYQVRVNGGVVKTVTDATSAKVVLTKEGENLIEVRYVHGETESEWVSISVTAYAVEYDTRSVAYGSFYIEYLAVGDLMTLPNAGFTYEGYDFSGWYNAPKGAAGNGKQYAEGSVFNGNAYTVVYAEWAPKDYIVKLKTDGFDITNIENGATETVTYSKHFTLPIPDAGDTGMYFFAGWYTGPSGTGVKITDGNGKSVVPYNVTGELTLYPYYSTEALTFTLQADGTYAVSKGVSISSVTQLEIPAYFNEIPVTKILESGFSSCTTLTSVSIPDTIKLVGTSAFTSCKNLETIEVYKAKEGNYETFYASVDGVLIREDMGTTYLEFVPRAKTGHLTIPSNVEKILAKAFYYSSLESITIPNNVIDIPKYAFYNCDSLRTLSFEPGRTNPTPLAKDAIYQCDAIEILNLPANLDMKFSDLQNVLQYIMTLKAINVEDGGTNYASVGGMLTNAKKDTILLCPKAYAGDFIVPSGIKTLGCRAFYYCDLITSVTIPVWVTTIEEEAFYMVDGYKEITFQGSRSEDLTIGESAFCYSYAEKITFEGNGTNELDTGKISIGKLAFTVSSSYGKLHTVEIGAGVNIETIGEKAFYRNNSLKNINIADTARIGTIGINAFDGCTGLKSITFPASLTSIGEYAFSGCTNLTDVTFKTEGATSLSIGDYAFNGCAKIESIQLPDHLDTFKSSAFEGCDALKEIAVNTTNKRYVNDENGILYQKTDDDTLTELLFYPKGLARELGGVINNLPETLTAIGGAAFSNNKFVVSVTIPAGVTEIGNSAFADCEKLQTIVFAATGTSLTIGEKAFLNCESLTDAFRLPAYTTKIGAAAFQGCKFTKFVIPEGVTEIGKAVFWGSDTLETVEFKCTGEVKILDGTANNDKNGGAFSNCSALKHVVLPKNLVEIGKYAFYKSYALETVTIGEVTKTVGANGETVYTVDSALERIGNFAFGHCVALKSIIIPKSVTAIGTSAFAMTETASGNNPGPGALEEVIFEMGGTELLNIGGSAFTHHPNLKTITFPARANFVNGVSGKDKDANGNNINLVPDASCIKSISIRAIFTGCTSLAEINIAVEEGVTSGYCSIDGVLYTADKTVLIYCPFANVGRYVDGEPTYEIIVPNTVKLVATYAFLECNQLKTLTFQEFDPEDANYGQQLLTIGNYSTNSSAATTKSYGTIGGKVSAITTINLPSHLAKIGFTAFANESEVPVSIHFNQDASNVVIADYAFNFANALALHLPGVKSLGQYSFANCDYLEEVTFAALDSSLTALPNYLFYKDVALKAFEIPAQITKIGTNVFYNCAAITEFEIPATVTSFGNSAFYGMSGITSITIPASIKNTGFGESAFQKCTSLVNVRFEVEENGKSPLTKIAKNAFNGCEALTDINLYDLELTEVAQSAFNGCAALTELDFTKFTSLKTVASNAFSNTSLEYVDLSATKITAMTTAFNNIDTLKTFIFPETVISVVAKPFQNDTALEKIVLSSKFTGAMLYPTATSFLFEGMKAQIVIPENNPYFGIDEYGVVYDPSFQIIYFASPTLDLSTYQIPDTVMTISQYAFAGNQTLGDFVIPSKITTIAQYAFQESSIKTVTIPASVTEIGQYAFADSDLEHIIFADEHNSKLETLGTYVFARTKLKHVVLPDNLTTLGNHTFSGCQELISITTGASMKEIPNGFTSFCNSFEKLIMQEGIETIRWIFSSYSYAGQYGSNNMTSITIPASVKVIESDAFCDFQKLTTVIFAEGNQLETIKQHAFRNCQMLKSINLPDSVTAIEKYAFYDCKSLEALDLSNWMVAEIPEYTFANTESLATLVLPRNLETIGTYAFFNSGVKNIDIPGMVSSIGISAFEDAKALETITFTADSMLESLGVLQDDKGKDVDSNIFKNTESLQTVVLPNGLVAIGHRVFENSGVHTITLADPTVPANFEAIGYYAFANCVNLTGFDYLQSVTAIGEAAFLNCVNLENATIHDGLETLGAMAFGFCNKLSTANIPASVMELGGNPFGGMDAGKINLDANNEYFVAETDNGVLTIYSADKTVVYGVFGATGMYNMGDGSIAYKSGALAGNDITEVTVPANCDVVPSYMFMNCNKLAAVTIESGITEIGSYAFHGTALATVEIPETVKTIGDYAFANCAVLDNVTMPATVTTFGNYCFAYCATLSNFVFEENTTTTYQMLGTHFFYNCPNITKVILPSNVKITEADGKASSTNSYSSTWQNAIPSYMFAGTGISQAEIPEHIKYYYTRGVFANCVNLEKIIITNHPTSSSTSTTYNRFNASWTEGCDKFQYYYSPYFNHHMAYIVESMYFAGIYELHMGKVFDTSEDAAVTEFGSYARFEYVGAEFCLYFDDATYQEIIPYFEIVARDWKMRIFDKNGYELFCDETTGNIVRVVDTRGNVVWEAEK